jgi:hypothetical protein
MIANLPSQYQDSPLIVALCQAVIDQLVTVQQSAEDLSLESLLMRASGVWLQQWETTVGAPSGDLLSDDERRVIVLAYGMANGTDATPRAIRDLLNLLGLGFLGEWFCGGFIRISGPIPSFPSVSTLQKIVARGVAAGMGVHFDFTTGDLISDQSLRELFLYAWTISSGLTATKESGILLLEGTGGLSALTEISAETGAVLVISGQYRGTAPLLILDESGEIGDFPQSDDWADFEVTWTAGSSTGVSPVAGENTTWIEIRNLSAVVVDPAGVITRTDRNFVLGWEGLAGFDNENYNGFGWDGSADPDPSMLGGLLSWTIEAP